MWNAAPSYEELSILLTENEASMNSRPGNILCSISVNYNYNLFITFWNTDYMGHKSFLGVR